MTHEWPLQGGPFPETARDPDVALTVNRRDISHDSGR
jgi:hypothetical protein